jgi:plastocyanin
MKTTARLTALVAIAACGGAASVATARPVAHATRTTTVTLKDISFKKSTVRIAKGASVTWVWKDGPSPHNVTFATRHSKTQKTGTYTLTFAKAGTFTYHCTLHPGMDGKVVVR